jgi:hypothetical protein
MPAEHGSGLHDEERRSPRPHAAGQEHQQRAIGPGATRPLDAAVQDGELVAEERVLGDERRLAPRQVGEGADGEGRDGRARGGQQSAADALRCRVAEHDHAV